MYNSIFNDATEDEFDIANDKIIEILKKYTNIFKWWNITERLEINEKSK